MDQRMKFAVCLANPNLDDGRLTGWLHDPGHLETGDLCHDSTMVVDGSSSSLADDRGQAPHRRIENWGRLDLFGGDRNQIDSAHSDDVDSQVGWIADTTSQSARMFGFGDEVQMVNTGPQSPAQRRPGHPF